MSGILEEICQADAIAQHLKVLVKISFVQILQKKKYNLELRPLTQIDFTGTYSQGS